jgi:hypothetical protein
MNKQIKYVAVRPDGTICGPIADKKSDLKLILIKAYKRMNPSGPRMNFVDDLGRIDRLIWSMLKEEGYKIKLANVEIIEQ